MKEGQGQQPEVQRRKRIPHQRWWREEKQLALDRMQETADIPQLVKELGIPRRTLYCWRDEAVAKGQEGEAKLQTREQKLERELGRVKEALAERTLDIDFFKGALQKIRERRRSNSAAGESASTSKSGK
jgi:transposase-like protein